MEGEMEGKEIARKLKKKRQKKKSTGVQKEKRRGRGLYKG